jgi:Tol biopolymer transport system component
LIKRREIELTKPLSEILAQPPAEAIERFSAAGTDPERSNRRLLNGSDRPRCRHPLRRFLRRRPALAGGERLIRLGSHPDLLRREPRRVPWSHSGDRGFAFSSPIDGGAIGYEVGMRRMAAVGVLAAAAAQVVDEIDRRRPRCQGRCAGGVRLRGALASVIAALAAGCGGGEENAGVRVGEPVAAPERDRPELAISRIVTGNPPRRDLVVVDAFGRNPRELATRAWPYFSRPAWSPEGDRVAFAAVTGGESGRDERSDILVVEASGGRPRRLTSTGRAFAPVWSPDGQTIVFSERSSVRFPWAAGLWAMSAAGGERRPLLEAERGRIDVASAFSPDGAQLAFTRCAWPEFGEGGRVENTCSIYLLDVRRLELRRLAERAADAAFSPNGAEVAYVSDRDQNGELSYGDRVFYANELYVMDADGGEGRRLTRTRDLNERRPSWSPNGGRIAYERGEVTGNAEASSVLMVRRDGSCPRRIAFDRGLAVWYGSPSWRPGTVRADSDLDCRSERAGPAAVPLAGNLSVDQARRFRSFGLYWVGRRFDRFVLSSISRSLESGPGGRGPVVDLQYGGFEIQLWPACARVPAHVAGGPDERIRLRGLDAFLFDAGNRLEIVTGKTTIVIFAERRLIVRAARALRPLNPAVVAHSGSDLPPPAPGALARKLPCR